MEARPELTVCFPYLLSRACCNPAFYPAIGSELQFFIAPLFILQFRQGLTITRLTSYVTVFLVVGAPLPFFNTNPYI